MSKSQGVISDSELVLFALLRVPVKPKSVEQYMTQILQNEFRFKNNGEVELLLQKFIDNWDEIDRKKVGRAYMDIIKYLEINRR